MSETHPGDRRIGVPTRFIGSRVSDRDRCGDALDLALGGAKNDLVTMSPTCRPSGARNP